jgi:uracil-DNA glycosylase family 4
MGSGNLEVPPSGSLLSKIALVGEAPGAEDVVNDPPMLFVGHSGQLLWRALAEEDFTRDAFYVTSVVKTRPPDNKIELSEIKAFDPHWLSQLAKELRDLQPNLVVALGITALNALCNYTEDYERIKNKELSIMSWRGSVLPSTLVPGLKVLATLAPATVIKQWSWLPLFTTDLTKIRAEAEYREIRRRSRTIHLFPSYKQALDYMGDVTTPYATDVEIRNGELACFSVAPSDDEVMSIPIVNGDLTPYWSEHEELGIWKGLATLLAKPIPSIGQNYVFDLFWYHIYGCKPWLDVTYDTMLMQNLIQPEMDKDLATLCSLYTDHPFYKDEGKVWVANSRIPDEQFFRYNGTDSIITRECWTQMCNDLKEMKLWDFYHNISMKLIPCVLKPMLRGLRVDLKHQLTVYDQYQTDIVALTARFKEIVGRDINPNSTKQLKEYLYTPREAGGCGLKEQKNKKTKNVTVDEETLELFNSMYVMPELGVLLDIREKSKTASTFIDPKRNDSDGRSRCSYNIPGTDSGRMSSSKGPLGSGGNLQNITHGLCRSIYIPDDGYCWLEADEGQAEARIVAHIAPEPKLIALFQSGKDVHKFNAGIAFEVPYEQVDKPKRFVAKHLVHACDYDVQDKTFAKTMNKKCRDSGIPMHMTPEDARDKIERFHGNFPGIRIWHKDTQERLRVNTTLVNLLGRPHTFLDRYGPDMFRKAYNWQAQSVVADVINIAWVSFNERYPQYDVMMQIHDALMIQCRICDVDKVKRALAECFDIELEANGYKFKIPVEFKLTETRWSEMRDA